MPLFHILLAAGILGIIIALVIICDRIHNAKLREQDNAGEDFLGI